MNPTSSAKINLAVDQALDHCLSGEKSPFAALADFTLELAKEPGWTDDEIKLVSSIAAQLLDERNTSSSEE